MEGDRIEAQQGTSEREIQGDVVPWGQRNIRIGQQKIVFGVVCCRGDHCGGRGFFSSRQVEPGEVVAANRVDMVVAWREIGKRNICSNPFRISYVIVDFVRSIRRTRVEREARARDTRR